MYDYLIKGGTLVDGTGIAPEAGDVAVKDGVIAEVGGTITGSAVQTIDADGALVTPGWVDVHTHYDGQVSWDDEIAPSSHNGVTTVVMGNCGVGFAPVSPGKEKELIELMEGVEDIPGAALHEGMEWGAWQSFPEYLDYIAGRRFALDVGAQIAHGAVRFHAMGERGRLNEDATADDIATMAKLVAEAVDAGAVGFSTSRTIGHRALWGEPVPGTFAPVEELMAIAHAMGNVGKGVFEMIPAGTVGELKSLGGERTTQDAEHEIMRQFSIESGRPVTFTLVQSPDYDPDLWRNILRMTDEANVDGAQLFPQVSSRPIGFLTGLSAYHAFMRKPTYLEKLAHLPLAERARAMQDPEIRQALMTETSVRPDAPGSMENVYGLFTRAAPVMFPLNDPVDYEPGREQTLGAQAAALGREPIDVMYDYLLEDGGTRFASLSTVDTHARMDVLREMLMHPATVTGLSDAGAHVTLICDGSMPTTQLTHWTRDRTKGEQIPLEFLVHKQTARNAALYGFNDRGTLQVGKRADLNVIDHANLNVSPPVAHQDLPAGGTRLMQPVQGYVATLCAGEMTRSHDEDTGARPGTVVRCVHRETETRMNDTTPSHAGQALQALIDSQIADGRQIGVQVCAVVDGEPFLDVVAGSMGPEDPRPVQDDSLFLSFSSTKGPTALVIHQLADRGELDYETPVSQYWPAFGANGKEQLTVAQAMSHQGGLHAMPDPFEPEHITDWDAGIERMERAIPAWTPGTATGYHAVTYGWIAGGIVAAVTGRHIRDVIRTEIAEPLGVADEFFVGTPDDPALNDRFATLEITAAGTGLPIPADSPFYEAMPKAMWPHFNTLAFRQACLPSGNGHFSARSLARMYGALANGGEIDGVRLVSADRIAEMQKVQTAEVDRVLGTAIRKNTGFFLGGLGPDLQGDLVHGPVGPRETAFGHPGAGGSVGFADPEIGLGMAVTVNKMAYPDPGTGVTLEICDLVRSLVP